jgi:type IV pilus assembly protein PilQ
MKTLDYFTSVSCDWNKPLTRLLFNLFLSTLLLLLLNHTSQAQSNNRLERLGHSSLPGNKIQVVLELAVPLSATPPHFSTDNPARIVVDFPNTRLNAMERTVNVSAGAVQQVRAVETEDRVRVVINLLRMSPFDIQQVGNKIFVSIDGTTGSVVSAASDRNDPINMVTQQAAAAHRPAMAPPPAVQTVAYVPPAEIAPASDTLTVAESLPAGPAITQVDFRRNDDGAGWIVVEVTNPNQIVSINRGRRERDIEVVFQDTILPSHLDRRLDVTDFATPVNSVDAYPQGKDARMLVTMREGVRYDYFANQTGRQYIIKINERPVEPEEQSRGLRSRDPVYTGRNVNFNFQDIQIRSALNLLLSPEVSGEVFNVVITDNVNQGDKLSLRLQNVPWDQALDIILEAKGLAKRKFGQNVIIIDTKRNLDAREKEELQAQKDIKELEPIRTQYIQINYAKAEDLAKLLDSGGTTDQAQRFISDKGSVSFDERTNTLIVQDIESFLQDIRQLIEAIDTPARQVLIESRVVIAEDSFARELGVKFGHSLNQDLGSGHGIVMGGKLEGDTTYSGGTAFTSGGNTFSGEYLNANSQENFIVRLPVGDPAGALGLAIGKVGSYLLQLELAASQTDGTAEVLATPKVITANQHKASIIQGQRIPYRTVSDQGAQTQFENAVLQLEVKPQITPDDRIIMDLLVTSDEMGQQILTTGERAINKREIATQVLVDNGETVVLGGVYQQNNNNSVTRVPFFSDLPLVGNLFKRTQRETSRRELLIFVTPKIIRERS